MRTRRLATVLGALVLSGAALAPLACGGGGGGGSSTPELTPEQAAYIHVPKDGPYKSDHYRY